MAWNPTDGISNYQINTAVPAAAATTPSAGVTANSAQSGNVNPLTSANALTGTADNQNRTLNNNELVSNQISNIVGADSPLMQRASSMALRNANQRGLLNSSMANEAAVGAVLDRATPIAQEDANAFTNVADRNLANNQQTAIFNAGQNQNSNQFNASQENQTNQFNNSQQQQNNQYNASNQQQTNLQNASNTLQNNQFNATEANKNSIFNASEANKVLLQFLDQSNKLQLADIEATYKTIMQSEASAGQLYQQSIRNISDILQNPDLTPQAKTAAVNNQNALLRTGMQLIGKIGGLNLDNLLVFPTA